MSIDLDAISQAIDERDQALHDIHLLASEMIYQGNSVSWWHSQAKSYKNTVLECWGALEEAGIKADGEKSVADAIRELASTYSGKASIGDTHANLYDKQFAMINEWHDTAVSLGCDGVRDLFRRYEAIIKKPVLVK